MQPAADGGSPLALIIRMRILLGLIVVVTIAGAVLTHRKNEQAAATPVATAKAASAQPAAPREVSQHDWAKRSLDRAADVKRQVAEQQKENGTK